jgi:predicted transposase YdaD
MLAERVVEWTEKWKQEGLQEGRQEGRQEVLERARGVLLLGLEKRFGPLPAEVRQRVEAIGSIDELFELSLRVGSAPSLNALGLS